MALENRVWDSVSAIEDAIWPAKVAETAIPSYVVPIRPIWAAQLFDTSLAEDRLFPADPMLLFRSENVYYSAASCASIEAPARLLWYVSHDTRIPGSKAIRAASSLTEVTTGPAKNVYRRFRRLGVYKWADVAEIARDDGGVSALRFGNTETLQRPILWDELQTTLRDLENRKNQFQRPTRINTATYDTLYRQGLS